MLKNHPDKQTFVMYRVEFEGIFVKKVAENPEEEEMKRGHMKRYVSKSH